VRRLVFRFKIFYNDNIPKEGQFILACNHISLVDPMFTGSNIGRLVHFMAKKELFKNRFLGRIITITKTHPISRGIFDRGTLAIALQVLKSGDGLVIFPEGTRALKGDFLPARPGVGMLAIQAGVMVVPTYIHGSNRLLDSFWGRVKPGIIYGRPIGVDEIAAYKPDKENYREMAGNIMSRIKSLKAEFLKRTESR
jgi:1-acyl-sn-glycerol-3-phosphate acyltransferase